MSKHASPTPHDEVDPVAVLADALGIAPRWVRPLAREGITDVRDMAGWTVDDLRGIQGLGERGATFVEAALDAAGQPLLPPTVRVPGKAPAQDAVRHLDVRAFTLALGYAAEDRRVTYRLYKARLKAAENGKWAPDRIPRPDYDVDPKTGRRGPLWDPRRKDVRAYIEANQAPSVIDYAAWWTTEDMAAALDATPARVIDLLHKTRTGRRTGGGIPEPDLSYDPGLPHADPEIPIVIGRKRLLWNPARVDVQEAVRDARDRMTAVRRLLKDQQWLRDQYRLPPNGAGRSVQAIAAERGVSRKAVADALRAVLEGTGEELRTRPDPAPGRKAGPPVPSHTRRTGAAGAGEQAKGRRARATLAGEILAADPPLPLSDLQRQVVQARAEHPDLTAGELAERLGITRGSFTGCLSKAVKAWQKVQGAASRG